MSNRTFLGKVGTTPKGEWSASVTYERLDWVTYQGSSYIALTQNTNSVPSDTNTNWMVAAKHGEFTEEQLEEFKEEVVRESKQEIDDYTDDKKEELDTYEGTKEAELNTYTGTKKGEIDTHAAQKINDYNANATSKTNTFNDNAETKTTNFNDNATSKTNAYNQNAEDKTTAFNTNAANKQTAFDNNATQKTTDFNTNATSKTTDFNDNAEDKTQDFDDNATEKTEAFDQNAQDKTDDFDEHVAEFTERIVELEQENKDLRNSQYKIYTETPSTNVTLNKTSKNKFIKFGVNGNREQFTSTGKNIFNCNGISRTDGGITVTGYADGTLKITGTATTIVYPNITAFASNFNYDFGNAYLLSDGLTDHENIRIAFEFSNGSLYSDSATSRVINGAPTNAYVRVRAGTYNVTLKPMLRLATTDDTYEPYTYGQAPNPNYECPISSAGDDINLFDKDNAQYVENLYVDAVQLKYASTTTGIRIYYMACKPNTTYTYSKSIGSIVKLASSVDIPVANGAVTASNLDSSAKSATITTGANDNYIVVLPLNSSELATISWEDVLSSIKLQEGSIATPYSPYNMGHVNVVKYNKNWLDSNAVKNNYRLAQDGGELSDEGYYVSAFIKIKPNTTYTKNSPTADAYYRMCFYYTDDVTSFISKTESNTATSPSNAQYLKICGLITEIDTTQIEENPIATSYTPHEEEVFNMPCQKPMPDQSDYFDWENELEIHGWKKLVLDGTEDGYSISKTKENSTFFQYANPIFKFVSAGAIPNVRANYLIPCDANALYSTDTIGIAFSSAGNIRFNLPNSIAATVTELKTWLTTHNLIVIGELKEPEKLPFTAEQKAVAKQIKDSTSYYEQTTVSSADPVSPILDITAVGDQNLVIDSIDARLSLVE